MGTCYETYLDPNFIDFEKAFDSPPRGALYEVLNWIGIPPDLLTMVMAIHEDPKGKVSGTGVWFRVARGIRQGCVLGPTMFIILLEFCIRMADLSDLGVDFQCVATKQLSLPADLHGVRFKFTHSAYADDVCLVGGDEGKLSLALDRLQGICGKIGLNISVAKTEWIYLHNPATTELEDCGSRRTPLVHCCDKIKLNGVGLRHVSSFKYLGSVVSERGGVEADTRFRILQAQLSLSRYNGIWSSDMTLRQKVRFLKAHVIPVLAYGAECGNHTQLELSKFSVFLNMCRRRLLQIGRRTAEGVVIANEELLRRCRLMQPLDLLSRRRVAFVAGIVARPSCEMARRLLFAKVAPPLAGAQPKIVSGRQRSSFLNVLDLDVKYLYCGEPVSRSLESLLDLAWRRGPPFVKQMLKALKPDLSRGASLKLVSARTRELLCPAMGCTALFAEQKEVNRHVRNNHPVDPIDIPRGEGNAVITARAPLGRHRDTGGSVRQAPDVGVISTNSNRTAIPCKVAGCSKVFYTPGWLARHIKSNHTALAEAVHSNTPPTVCTVAVVEPEPLRRSGTGGSRCDGPLVIGAGAPLGVPSVNDIPVPLIGDDECGSQGHRRSLHPRDVTGRVGRRP